MKNFGNKLLELRKSRDYTIDELVEKLNNVSDYKISRSAISRWENNKSEPTATAISLYAKVFNTDMNALLGIDRSNAKMINLDIQPRRIPILGKIAAGTPILAVENHEDYFDTSEFINADFALQIQGDSMIGSRIFDGDIVFLKNQPYVENGEIGAFLIDGEATLKIFNKQNNTIMLLSSNPSYPPIILSPDVENLTLGKLIGVYSRR